MLPPNREQNTSDDNEYDREPHSNFLFNVEGAKDHEEGDGADASAGACEIGFPF